MVCGAADGCRGGGNIGPAFGGAGGVPLGMVRLGRVRVWDIGVGGGELKVTGGGVGIGEGGEAGRTLFSTAIACRDAVNVLNRFCGQSHRTVRERKHSLHLISTSIYPFSTAVSELCENIPKIVVELGNNKVRKELSIISRQMPSPATLHQGFW